jgi:uncharacterized membrane protein
MAEKPRGLVRTASRYVVIGLITVAPLGITWLSLSFLFGQLSYFGRPWVIGVARALRPRYPDLAAWLLNETLQSFLAVIIVVAFLYLLGWGTTRVIGRRLIALFDSLVARIPLVDAIYRSVKRLFDVASIAPEGERRVVLINFPSRDMKAVGVITRTIRDSETGEELAAVYVPTAPNPTSGYIEVLPLKDVILTDWTFDQAMAFVVTFGTASPDHIAFSDGRRIPDASADSDGSDRP